MVNNYAVPGAIQGGEYYIDGGLGGTFTVEVKRTPNWSPNSHRIETVFFNKSSSQGGATKNIMGNTLEVKLKYSTQHDRWEIEFH